MKKEHVLDTIDLRILALLQKNARLPNAEIARCLRMAPSAVFERLRKLEKSGVLQGFEPRISPSALCSSLVAFIYVRADERVGSLEAGKLLAQIPEVQEVHCIAGEDRYLVKVRVAGTDALAALLRDRIGTIRSVRSTRTTIGLTTLKETSQLPLTLPHD